MDLNIDNYNNNEIYNLLKINKMECNINLLFKTILNNKTKISNSNIDNKNEILNFFNKCFIRLSIDNNYTISNNIAITLNLHKLNKNIINYTKTIDENINYNKNDIYNKNNYDNKNNIYNKNNYDNVNGNTNVNSNTNNFVGNKYYNDLIIPKQNNSNINNNKKNSFSNHICGLYNEYNNIFTTILIINSKYRENTNNMYYNLSHTYKIKLNNDRLIDNNYNYINGNDKFTNYKNTYNVCNNESTTNFTINLQEPYNNVISLRLASVELMNSYYSVSEYLKTNEFTIHTFEYQDGPNNIIQNPYSHTFKFDNGSYSSLKIHSRIQNDLSGNPQLNHIEAYYDLNNNTGKIIFRLLTDGAYQDPNNSTITWKKGFHLDFSIKDNVERPAYLNFGWLLGYKKLKYDFFNDYIFALNSNNDLQIGFNPESPVNLLGTTFFLLEVDDFNNNHPKVVNYNINSPYSFNLNKIIAKIPNAVETNSLFFEDSSDRIFKTREYFGPVNIKRLKIKLLDENGLVVDLNNTEIILSFEIKCINN